MLRCLEQVQVRERYTKILSVFLILLASHMNASLDKLFGALGKICRDDEDAVVQSVRECSRVIGHYADSQMILASLLPMVRARSCISCSPLPVRASAHRWL